MGYRSRLLYQVSVLLLSFCCKYNALALQSVWTSDSSSGYDQGVFSGIVGNEDFLTTVNNPDPSLLGIIVSIYNLGCFTGCIVTFLVGEKLGRRKMMWLAMAFIIVRVE